MDIILGTRYTVCSLKHICESVLESFVSRYENHFDSRRSTNEETSNEEFDIAVNGPSLAHCDGIGQEAKDKYWKDKSNDGKVGGEWHFYKKSVLEKLSSLEDNSVVLKIIMKQKNNLPFINY